MPFRLEVRSGFNSQETIDRGKVKLPYKQFAFCLIDRKYQVRFSFDVRLCFPRRPLRGREELTVHAHQSVDSVLCCVECLPEVLRLSDMLSRLEAHLLFSGSSQVCKRIESFNGIKGSDREAIVFSLWLWFD